VVGATNESVQLFKKFGSVKKDYALTNRDQIRFSHLLEAYLCRDEISVRSLTTFLPIKIAPCLLADEHIQHIYCPRRQDRFDRKIRYGFLRSSRCKMVGYSSHNHQYGYTPTHTSTRTHTHLHIHTYTHLHIYNYTHTHPHTHTRAQSHTHTHTHTQ